MRTVPLAALRQHYLDVHDEVGSTMVENIARCSVSIPYAGCELPCCTFRLVQVEAVRQVLALHCRPQALVVEIGFGTASVLNALVRHGCLPTGAELAAEPSSRRSCLDVALEYSARTETIGSTELVDNSVDVVVAVDVFKARFGVRPPFRMSSSPLAYLRQLSRLLRGGGALLYINDHAQPGLFERETLRQAGFAVERWAESACADDRERLAHQARGDEGRYCVYRATRLPSGAQA